MLQGVLWRTAALVPALVFSISTASAGGYSGSLKDGPAIEESRWTGLYGGLNAQYSWTNQSWPGQNPYVAPPTPCGNAFPNAPGPNKDCGPPKQDLEGAMFGGTLGYNFQFDRVVLGVEGDFDFGNIKDAERDGNYLIETTKVTDFATIRGRLGYAIGDFLPYVTGGVAFENFEYGESCPSDASSVAFGWCRPVAKGGHGPYDLSKSQWNTGYVVGGGVEWAVTERISLKAEGLYADFGEQTYNLGPMADGKPLPTKIIDHNETIFRLGANFKLF